MSMKKILFAFAVFAAAQNTYAQKDSVQNILDEVVVTATKSPKKLSETGKVIAVITKEQIEKVAAACAFPPNTVNVLMAEKQFAK